MSWIYIIFGIIIVWWIIERTKKKKVENLDNKMENLEARGDKYFVVALDEAHKEIDRCRAILKSKNWIIGTEDEYKSSLEVALKKLKGLNDTREAFVRLKEATRFRPVTAKIEVFEDWKNYGSVLFLKENNRKHQEICSSEDSYRLWKQGTEYDLQIEEVEKRFQQRLKQS